MGTRYNYNKKKSKKKYLLILIVIIIIIILVSLIRPKHNKLNESYESGKVYLTTSDFKSVKEILEYYGNTYIDGKQLKDDKYEYSIYTKFKCDLYENEESNETFYYRLVNTIAKFLEYKNFKLIDSSRNITIKVTCQNEKIALININGDTNYFKTMDSKLALAKHGEKEITKFEIQSDILKQLIANDWVTKDVNFGTKESRFDKYDIYFDEGIEVKTISGKVFNVIFTDKYTSNIVNNITVKEQIDNIKEILGKPTFEDITSDRIGYKGEDMYIFFADSEVSIYRVEKNLETSEFIELIKRYNEDKDAKSLGNDLTDLWNDYDKYNYDSNFVELQYTLKGVKMQFNVGNPNGFILYSNYNGLVDEDKNISAVKDTNELPERIYIEDTDLVFETERERQMNEYFKYNFEGQLDDEEIQAAYSRPFFMTESAITTETHSGIKFISLTKEYADSELDENLNINEYVWKDDFNFIYSVRNEGIYEYNCKTRELKSLITGTDNFKIDTIENGILKYDDKTLSL